MKILKKLRNIWALGEIELTDKKREQITNLIIEKPHLAEIIKRKTPVEKFLENTNVESV